MKNLLLLIIALSFTRPALSDQALELGDRFLDQGNYDEAITEYRRFIFFNPESDQIGCVFYRLGLAYRAGYNWKKSIDAFRASILASTDAETANERRIVLATTLIASGNYNAAKLELLRVSEYTRDPSLRLKCLYFGGVASLYMSDWKAAKAEFDGFYAEYAQSKAIDRAREINSILFEVQRAHKSSGLAKVFSCIVPGSGQIYAGEWRDGLNALALNGLIIGLITNAVYKKEYKNALIIYSISSRYYRGNIYRAGVDVEKYNESLDRRNAIKILQLIRENEPK